MTFDFREALALARERWAQYCTHDLPDETWLQLFEAFGAPAVLQACRGQASVRSPLPNIRYEFLLRACEYFAGVAPRSDRIR